MIYTVEKASLVSERLRKFVDSYSYKFVGQYANVDFWMAEVVIALKALDEHRIRFNKMCDAQKQWVENHGTRIADNCPICGGICELSQTGQRIPELPKNRSKRDIIEARQELVDAAYFFLIRSFHLHLLSEAELNGKCEEIGTGVDPADLEPQNDTKANQSMP